VKKGRPSDVAVSYSPLGLGLITPRYIKESVPSFISGLYVFRLVRAAIGATQGLLRKISFLSLSCKSLCVHTASSRKPVQPLHTGRINDTCCYPPCTPLDSHQITR